MKEGSICQGNNRGSLNTSYLAVNEPTKAFLKGLFIVFRHGSSGSRILFGNRDAGNYEKGIRGSPGTAASRS